MPSFALLLPLGLDFGKQIETVLLSQESLAKYMLERTLKNLHISPFPHALIYSEIVNKADIWNC